jgi:hypothetical protein
MRRVLVDRLIDDEKEDDNQNWPDLELESTDKNSLNILV